MPVSKKKKNTGKFIHYHAKQMYSFDFKWAELKLKVLLNKIM